MKISIGIKYFIQKKKKTKKKSIFSVVLVELFSTWKSLLLGNLINGPELAEIATQGQNENYGLGPGQCDGRTVMALMVVTGV